jgi:mono/diheme cytochrome c family protein
MRRPLWSLVGLLLAAPAFLGAQDGPQNLGTEAQLATGKTLYAKYCSQCHGDSGDGQGVAAPYLKPAPRDFTSGKYKIRRTPTGSLPTTEDIKRSIRLGLPYTGMPAFPIFSEEQLTSLAQFLKTFSKDFQDPEAYLPPFPIPKAPPVSAASVERGQALYVENGCIRCHGNVGRGDGNSAPTLVDDWGKHIRAAELTKPWTFRGGMAREDLFRSMSSGLNGTPMPGFHGALPVEDIWAIVDYILSLSGNAQQAPYANLVRAVGVNRNLDLAEAEELFADAPKALLPVVGQIMEPGREFHPAVNAVSVQAVFNRDEIAFRVSWDDMRAERTGANGPELPAPTWEQEHGDGAAAAASGEGDGGGFWGDAEATGDEAGGSFWGDEEVSQPAPAAEGGSDDFWGDAAVAESADTGGGDDFWGQEAGAGDTGAGAAVQSEFSDAVALQFPSATPTGIRKPYFLFGDIENPVHLWFADLVADRAKLYEARGSTSVQESPGSVLEMVSSYTDGEWSVIFKRKRRGPGVPFTEGTFTPIAATVWDGFNRERGNKRGLTAWYDVYLEPMKAPSPFAPMAKAGLGVLALELLLVGLVRRKKKKQAASAPS